MWYNTGEVGRTLLSQEEGKMTCKICGGALGFLGKLGNLTWVRCQDCGAEFSIELIEEEEDEGTYRET